MAAKRISLDDIRDAVQEADLALKPYANGHYQIYGGEKVVNLWPFTKRGFRFQVDGEKSKLGDVRAAINAAGKRKTVARETINFPHGSEIMKAAIDERWPAGGIQTIQSFPEPGIPTGAIIAMSCLAFFLGCCVGALVAFASGYGT